MPSGLPDNKPLRNKFTAVLEPPTSEDTPIRRSQPGSSRDEL